MSSRRRCTQGKQRARWPTTPQIGGGGGGSLTPTGATLSRCSVTIPFGPALKAFSLPPHCRLTNSTRFLADYFLSRVFLPSFHRVCFLAGKATGRVQGIEPTPCPNLKIEAEGVKEAELAHCAAHSSSVISGILVFSRPNVASIKRCEELFARTSRDISLERRSRTVEKFGQNRAVILNTMLEFNSDPTF